MNKIKLFVSIFVAGFVAIAVVTVNIQANKIKVLKSEIERIKNNNLQLMTDNRSQTNLILRQNEITGLLKYQVDSLAKSLKVKPKFIDRIVYQTITEKDTVVKNVFVSQFANHEWLIADTGKCFVWKGIVTLSDTVLSVKRNEFDYQNKITFVAYKKRPNRFLFFNYGKRINFVDINPGCGDVWTETFEFIK